MWARPPGRPAADRRCEGDNSEPLPVTRRPQAGRRREQPYLHLGRRHRRRGVPIASAQCERIVQPTVHEVLPGRAHAGDLDGEEPTVRCLEIASGQVRLETTATWKWFSPSNSPPTASTWRPAARIPRRCCGTCVLWPWRATRPRTRTRKSCGPNSAHPMPKLLIARSFDFSSSGPRR